MRKIGFLTLAAMVLLATQSFGQAVIVTTAGTESVALGVNALGHLNLRDPTGAILSANAGGVVGLSYASTALGDPTAGRYFDSTAPGCLCEGWGVSASGVGAQAAVSNGGVSGLTPISFSSTASTATSVVGVTALPGLTVEQAYSPAVPGALFVDNVKITNNTGGLLTDVRYNRTMDWDIPFTEFSEYVTIQGVETTAALERSHDNGFDFPNPLAFNSPLNPATLDVSFVDDGPADHGAYFTFNFGDLADGDSLEFQIFYGAATNEAAMLAALGAVSVELYSLGQSNEFGSPPGDPATGEPITYAFGFAGVGGEIIVPPPVIPEPGTFAIWGMLLSIGAVVGWRRHRSNQA